MYYGRQDGYWVQILSEAEWETDKHGLESGSSITAITNQHHRSKEGLHVFNPGSLHKLQKILVFQIVNIKLITMLNARACIMET